MLSLFTFALLAYNVTQYLPTTPKRAVEILIENDIDAHLNDDAGFSFFAPGLTFKAGSDEVSDISKSQINIIIQVLNLNGIRDDVVYVEGHSSSVGASAYNMDLSQRRAHNVSQQLIDNSLGKKRLIVIGRGEESPRFHPGTDVRNQRVEIIVIDAGDHNE